VKRYATAWPSLGGGGRGATKEWGTAAAWVALVLAVLWLLC
jgi:hypothetical protein